MRLFRWWFNGKEVERISSPVEPQPEISITIGSLWTMKTDDPFPSKYPPVEVLDVKEGWVRYRMGFFFPDERRTIKSFLDIYKEVA